jgi:hypothetical protein
VGCSACLSLIFCKSSAVRKERWYERTYFLQAGQCSVGVSNIDGLCGESVGGVGWGAVGNTEEGEHDLEQIHSFTGVHAAYERGKSIFYMHSISRHSKQNILNVELLFRLKRMASMKLLQITDFFGSK